MPSFVKLSRTVSKLWSGHECSTADGRTDGQKDGQTLKSSEGIKRWSKGNINSEIELYSSRSLQNPGFLALALKALEKQS